MKRWLYVKGVVRSPEKATVGEQILREYTDDLRKEPVFSDAKIQPRYAYENEQVYFELKIDLGDREG